MSDVKNYKINVETDSAVKNTDSLNSQLKAMQKEMAAMIAAGKEGTAEYEALAKQSGVLKDAIGDAARAVSRFADDTKTMNDVLDVSKSAISVFGLMQSAVSALGVEDEKLVKTIKSLQTAQTALSSVQQLQATIMDKSSATYRILNANIVTYTGTSKAAAIATKALNVALKGIGIGLIVGAIAEISSHMDDIKKNLSGILPFLKDETAEMERQAKLAKETAETEARRKGQIRELRILQGETLEVYKEELTAAQYAEEAAKRAYEERAAAYERALKAQNRTQSAYASMENKRDAAEEEFHKRQIERIKAEQQYNKELERQNKLTEKKTTTQKQDSQKEERVTPSESFFREDYFGNVIDDVNEGAINWEEEIKRLEETQNGYVEETREDAASLIEIFGKLKAGVMLSDEDQAKLERFRATMTESLNTTAEIGSQITEIVAMNIDENIKTIEDALKRVDKALTKSDKAIDRHRGTLESLYAEFAESEGAQRDALLESIEIEKNAMNEQFEEQKRLALEKEVQEKQLEKEKAKRDKADLAAQLVKSIANTAISISTSAQAGFPAAIPFIAMAAATGAIQTGIIAAQMGKIKYAQGGLLDGPSHSQGGIPVGNTGIEVEGGEYVVNKNATRRYLPLLEIINSGGKSTRKYADGGELNLPISETLRNLTSINFSPVVSVTDINKANSRLSRVRAK